MAPGVLLKTTTPICSVHLLDEKAAEETARSKAAAAELERTRQQLAQVCTALNRAIAEVESYRTALFSSQRENIVRLSLEIAAKILAKEVAEKNYAIEAIVLDALQSAPQSRHTTIRLNPEDAKAFEKAAAEQGISLPTTVEIAADWAVNPAECIINSDAGTVDSLIEEHLRHIGEALLGTGDRT